MDLKQFIQTNRDAFDQDVPPAHLWNRLAEQLPPALPQRHVPTAYVPGPTMPEEPWRAVLRPEWRKRQRTHWRWAASVALLLLAGGFGWFNSRYGVTVQPDVVAISPSYAKEVTHYANLINDKQAQLRQLTKSNSDLYRRFSGDLKSLTTSYDALRADLPQTPNQDVLIQAMIQNLQLQIDLLNEQLRVSQRLKRPTTTDELPAKPI